jgi:hypothetical protein
MATTHGEPWVNRAGLARIGREIHSWFKPERAPDNPVVDLLETVGFNVARLTAERQPQFPTLDDEPTSGDEWLEAQAGADEVEAIPTSKGYMLLGLLGLVGLCAVYPIVAEWVLVGLLGAGTSRDLLPITVGICLAIVTMVVLLANRWIPGRIATVLIVLTPFAVKWGVAASLGRP